jgi:(R,R)-butanediol dehydrogenase/meso-butanediol dehydrogenase/diacetyl reductase
MKAVVVDDRGQLVVETIPDPTPKPGELVLRVSACGISGSDLRAHRLGLIPPGSVMGHEFCGEVAESGYGLKAGDRVCALPSISCGECDRCRSGLGAYCSSRKSIGFGASNGAFAEYVTVAPHETVRLPDGVDSTLGALVEPLAVGLHAVNVGRIRRGETCLVIGAGPVGLAAALWARHFGAGQVIVSEITPARRALAERMGATKSLDPRATGLDSSLAEMAPEGPEVVFEAVGAPGCIGEAIDRARFRGRVVVAGLGFVADTIQPLAATSKEVSLSFVLAYEKDDFQYTVDMMEQERIEPRPIVTDRIGLDEVPEAFRALAKPDSQCKVVAYPG